ncbi:MAG: hypothetical protein WCO93_09605 [bacterium]
MRTFLYVSILLALVTGCSPSKKGSGSGGKTVKDTMPLPCYSGSFEKALFKVTLDIREQNMTGFLLLKKLSDSIFRMVFANEIGMTLFDLGFSKGKFEVHYLFDPMNKKILVKLFEKDFRYLIFGVLMPGSNPYLKTQMDQEGRQGEVPENITISNPRIPVILKMRLLSHE